jgi:hypothetical protein
MVILLNLFKEQVNQEIWLKNGEHSKTLQDSLRIHSDIPSGKLQLFQAKTELELSMCY